MKPAMPAINTPFFEIGIKNYLYGDDVLALARAADEVAQRHDVDTLFITPYTEIRRVAEATRRLVVLAPYMDTPPPGRGLANVLPEALKAAGAKGVVVNHCEKPMTLAAIQKTIARAHGLNMLVFACADTVAEARAMAALGPDIINPEPSELVGSGNTSGAGFVRASTSAIKAIDPAILVEQAAGITQARQVYQLVMAGAEGVGVASGIAAAKNPCATACGMIEAIAEARAALAAKTGGA